MRVAVVIPYFQRQPGLLSACVRSVLGQQGASAAQLIVVDDASPHPARQELAPLLQAHPQVQVVLQANAGPGAARNHGLDLVEPGTDIVAFLDSDDAWKPNFLADALEAFAHSDCDLFFANTCRYSALKPRFEWASGAGKKLIASEHEVLSEARGLYKFSGDFFDFAVRRSRIVSTSALAFRFGRLPYLRFKTELFHGEDRYFKLQLSQAARRTLFGIHVSVTEGQGVNIFDSSQWGSEKGLIPVRSYISMSKLIMSQLALTDSQRLFIQGELDTHRRNFALTVAHLVRTKRRLPPRLWSETLASDPATLLLFLPNLLQAAVQKLHPRR